MIIAPANMDTNIAKLFVLNINEMKITVINENNNDIKTGVLKNLKFRSQIGRAHV